MEATSCVEAALNTHDNKMALSDNLGANMWATAPARMITGTWFPTQVACTRFQEQPPESHGRHEDWKRECFIVPRLQELEV